MKMRKKLAALLAAAMIASVMPMTAFAATENRVISPVKVAKDTTTEGKAPILSIKNDKNDVTVAGGDFYLVLEGAEFLTPGAIISNWNGTSDDGHLTEAAADANKATNGGVYYTANGINFRVDSKTEMAVQIPAALIGLNNQLNIPIVAKVTADVATVSIDSNETTVGEVGYSAKKYVFAETGASKTNVTIADTPGIYTGRNLKVGKINLKEFYSGAMGGVTAAKAEILVELDDVDYEFVATNNFTAMNAADVTFKRGFAKIPTAPTLEIKYNGADRQAVVIKFDPADFKNRELGELDIQLHVDSIAKKPTVGKMNAQISGDIVTDQSVVLANVAEFGVTLAADKEYAFVTGQDEEVVFHLNEIIEDSMVTGRTTEFMLPKGVYFEEKVVGGKGMPVVELKTGDKVLNTDIEALRDKDGRIEGFTVDLIATPKVDKYKFVATLDITSAFEGDITLTAEGRAIGAQVEATIATTVAPVKVTIDPIKVKPGFKVQTGGKVVITETDKARLMQGKTLVVNLENGSGMDITDAKITVTEGDLRAEDIETTVRNGQIELKVKRKSKVASTIEITDIELRLDRSVPQGLYELHVGGSAISQLAETTVVGSTGKVYDRYNVANKRPATVIGNYGNDTIKTKDFAIVGDPITGVKSEVVFTIGSEKFVVDGVEQTMDAKAYIKDGRTMVPLRYLATALGIDKEAIKFNQGIVTIFVGNGNVVQVQIGSKNLNTNGLTIPMTTAAEIIEGRTYVPVTEIGSVFGVAGTWDQAAQTATFK